MTQSPDRDDVDLSSAETTEDFGRLMNALFLDNDYTYGRLNLWLKRAGLPSIPPSTLSNIFAGKYPPRSELLDLFLQACHLSKDEIDTWQAVRRMIVKQRRIPELGGGTPLHSQLAVITDELAETKRHVQEMQARETELRQALDAEVANCALLDQNLEELRTTLDAKDKLTLDLENELAEKAAVWEREREKVDRHVYELRTELRFTALQRERLEHDLARLRDDHADLSATSESIEDQLNLHYTRAEFERERHEQAAAEIASLNRKMAELEMLISSLRDQEDQSSRLEIESSLAERLRNQDIRTEFAASIIDFGEERQIPVVLEWYCPQCSRGGNRNYPTCPYCQTKTSREYTKSVLLKLPLNPCYGRTIRVANQGTHDEPQLRPGDLYVKIVERPSFIQRVRLGFTLMFKPG